MFTLPSYKHLKLSLGEHDAVVQFQECARLTLEAKYEVAREEKKQNLPDFIAEESEKHGIHLHNLTIKEYPNIIFQNYLIMPNSLLEEFVDNFIDDYNLLFGLNLSLPKDRSKCKFEKLLLLLNSNGITGSIQQKELDLYNYYRFIRNGFAHKLKSRSLSLSSVDVNYFQTKYAQLNAPNEFNALTFDDFILFTATVKSIAHQITQLIGPNINWQRFLRNNINMFPRLGKFKKQRAITYVQNCIKDKYGLILNISDIDCSIGPFE